MARKHLLPMICLLLACAAACCAAVRVSAGPPSNARPWVPEQAETPLARFDGSRVHIENVRNFEHGPHGPVHMRYEDRSYDLDSVATVSLVLSPFGERWRGPAHVFLSFGFDDGRHLGISVEARKEVGEDYTLAGGAARRFELAYIIADERDLISLRAAVWGDDVYVYPMRAERAKVRALLERMLVRANELAVQPEYYNTITNNCTTAIIDHANEVADRRIPYGWRVLLPGYADGLAVNLGLVSGTETIADARARYRVNERVLQHLHDPDFSRRIRAPE